MHKIETLIDKHHYNYRDTLYSYIKALDWYMMGICKQGTYFMIFINNMGLCLFLSLCYNR